MNLLVFDIGGTDIKYGIVNNGTLVTNDKIPTEAYKGGMSIVDKIINISVNLSTKYDFKGIAISSAGVINPNNGLVISATNAIPNYIGINIKEILEKKLKIEVWVQNDVNCFAVAEKHCGNAIGIDNFITLTIGTGIGGAIYMNNELVLGKDFSAGEVGRMTVGSDKFENISSITGLVNLAKVQGLDVSNGADVFKLFDEKNEKIINVVDIFYNNMAIGICNLIYTFNPDKILIGGGVTNRPTFIDELTPYIEKNIDNPSLVRNILNTTLNKNNSGLLGAYYNFLNYSKKSN